MDYCDFMFVPIHCNLLFDNIYLFILCLFL